MYTCERFYIHLELCINKMFTQVPNNQVESAILIQN